MSRTKRKEKKTDRPAVRRERIRAWRRNVKTKLKLGIYDELPSAANVKDIGCGQH